MSDVDALLRVAVVLLHKQGLEYPTSEQISRVVAAAAKVVPVSMNERTAAHNQLAADFGMIEEG